METTTGVAFALMLLLLLAMSISRALAFLSYLSLVYCPSIVCDLLLFLSFRWCLIFIGRIANHHETVSFEIQQPTNKLDHFYAQTLFFYLFLRSHPWSMVSLAVTLGRSQCFFYRIALCAGWVMIHIGKRGEVRQVVVDFLLATSIAKPLLIS